MVRILVAIAVLLSAVQFCAPAVADPGIADGAAVRSLGDRTYRVYKPADLPAAAPLVIVMHGLSGTAVNAEEKFGWNQLADSAKFVVAYPDGVSKSWNTTAGCCGNAGRQNVDDIGFLTGVVRDIGANVPIDPGRVYAAGISNGGVMAFALACQTDLFAAVGVVSGTQLGGCNPPNPPSVIQIHGTSDPIIHFDGSPGFGFAGGQPIPAIDAFWRDTNHCGAPSDRVDGALTISTAGCADGRGVELVTVGKGGHSWPPFATSMLWDFFAAHPR